MDPSVAEGGSFGQIWQYNFLQIHIARLNNLMPTLPPLYTPSTLNHQLVFVFPEQNMIYSLDAVNGSLPATRDLAINGEKFPSK